jgi:hypothetical protein
MKFSIKLLILAVVAVAFVSAKDDGDNKRRRVYDVESTTGVEHQAHSVRHRNRQLTASHTLNTDLFLAENDEELMRALSTGSGSMGGMPGSGSVSSIMLRVSLYLTIYRYPVYVDTIPH